jgi:S-adenosylmethionine:tRNA ribosyltransferase-isomerase
MVLGRDHGGVQHAWFRDLPRLLRPGSLVVLNDTRVIPARLRGHKPTGGAVEVLLVRPREARPAAHGAFDEDWEVLARGVAGLAPGTRLDLAGGVTGWVLEHGDRGAALVRLRGEGASVVAAAERAGAIPLPPYIEAARRREGAGPADDADRERYQTVYARVPGAVAAPTAGLHFTPALLDEVAARGHEVVRLTLHVGPGTFRPVEVEDPSQHRMEVERYDIPPETAAALARARADARPVVAVGTTVVRALEAAAAAGDAIADGPGQTDLFLAPGSTFRVVTDLVTNFHLPRSTLLMLVAAFAGRERVLAAYEEAVRAGYRFYSYGDAMFITPGARAR